jgi:hypothetical protein
MGAPEEARMLMLKLIDDRGPKFLQYGVSCMFDPLG